MLGCVRRLLCGSRIIFVDGGQDPRPLHANVDVLQHEAEGVGEVHRGQLQLVDRAQPLHLQDSEGTTQHIDSLYVVRCSFVYINAFVQGIVKYWSLISTKTSTVKRQVMFCTAEQIER